MENETDLEKEAKEAQEREIIYGSGSQQTCHLFIFYS